MGIGWCNILSLIQIHVTLSSPVSVSHDQMVNDVVFHYNTTSDKHLQKVLMVGRLNQGVIEFQQSITISLLPFLFCLN